MKAQLKTLSVLVLALSAGTASVLAEPVIPEAPAAVEPRAATVTPMQCYTEGPFLDCVKPFTSSLCADQKDPSSVVSCACSQGSALYSCYTSNCASDQYFSSYKAGLDACSAIGAANGGNPPAPAASATTDVGPSASNGGGGSGSSRTSQPVATEPAKNAVGPGATAPGFGFAGTGAALGLVLGVAAWL